MTSQLNVDTIADKAGSGPVGLTKQHAAKVWVNYNSSTTIRDSFGISNLVDDGTGDYTANFSVTFANDDFAVTSGGANGSASATAYHLATFDYTTTSVEMQTFSVAAASVARADRAMNNLSVHGDLA
jgi:hypothetical protein|tara:strand:- start:27 stop:407 length:381 start_codon:yes stop_codon:yes gene_type:complete